MKIAIIVVVALVALCFIFFRKKKRKNRSDSSESNHSSSCSSDYSSSTDSSGNRDTCGCCKWFSDTEYYTAADGSSVPYHKCNRTIGGRCGEDVEEDDRACSNFKSKY